MASLQSADRADLLIGGRRLPAQSGRYFETLDPANEQVITQVAEADAADIDAAVASARAAFEGEWGHLRAADRGNALLRLADLIRQNQDALIELESLDSGKPVSAVKRQDLPAVLDTLTYYAGWADKINGQVIPARPDALTYTVREPLGVVEAIIPELPPDDRDVEDRAGTCLWLHRGVETCGTDTANSPENRRVGTRSRVSSRRAECRARLRQDCRRGPRRPS